MGIDFRWIAGLTAAILASVAASISYLGQATSEIMAPVPINAAGFIPADVTHSRLTPPVAFTPLGPSAEPEIPADNPVKEYSRPMLKPFNLSVSGPTSPDTLTLGVNRTTMRNTVKGMETYKCNFKTGVCAGGTYEQIYGERMGKKIRASKNKGKLRRKDE